MKKLFLTAALMLISTSVFASDIFGTKPMPINIDMNPASVNGTYEIDRFVIREGGKTILDSENDYMVKDDKGEATVVFKDNQIELVYKMQMTGRALDKGAEFEKYSFIYDKKALTLPAGATNSERFKAAGIRAYDHDELIIEIPIENGRILGLLLDKESDKVKSLSNSKYLFL